MLLQFLQYQMIYQLFSFINHGFEWCEVCYVGNWYHHER